MEDTLYALNPWWEGRLPDTGVPRETYLDNIAETFERPQLNVLLGSRRVGKTTLLRQLIGKVLGEGTKTDHVLYLLLDHPRLAPVPLLDHLRTFRGLFDHSRATKLYLFLDEVQESPNWEAELKALCDTENVKIVCTGSTASLLDAQGGKLTGRQIVTTLHPLSFSEFVQFRVGAVSPGETYRYGRLAEEYLQIGGYPENVLAPSEEYLHNLVQDILARDLVRLHDIRRSALLTDLLRLVAASVGSRVSFGKLARTLGVAVDTAKEYVGYFESAFLVGSLEKWTPSHTERVYATRKLYLTDTGVKTLFTGSGDLGAKAESAVFMHLVRQKSHAGYFAESQREVDFVVGDVSAPLPIEVKYTDDLDLSDSRLSGLKLFLRRHPETATARVVTRTQETTFTFGRTRIELVPLWKLLRQ